MTQPRPILLVLPFAAHDHQIALDLLAWIGELEPRQDRPILLVPATSVGPETRAKATALAGKAFSEVRMISPSLRSGETGWPKGANATFAAVVEALYRYKDGAPFYFFEPDNTPTRAGWLRELDGAYLLSGHPFVGVFEPTRRLNPATGKIFTSGQHLVGTAIYSRRLPEYTKAYRDCGDLGFDVAMEKDIVPHAEHTDLIQHNWLTCNYRRDADGAIICDAAEGRRSGQKEFSLARPVGDKAAVVHGCKDGSLIHLLRCTRVAGRHQEWAERDVDGEPMTSFGVTLVPDEPPPQIKKPRARRGKKIPRGRKGKQITQSA